MNKYAILFNILAIVYTVWIVRLIRKDDNNRWLLVLGFVGAAFCLLSAVCDDYPMGLDICHNILIVTVFLGAFIFKDTEKLLLVASFAVLTLYSQTCLGGCLLRMSTKKRLSRFPMPFNTIQVNIFLLIVIAVKLFYYNYVEP